VKDLDPGVSPRHHLGAEIRRAREEAGMSQAELAKITSHDRTYVTKAETGDIDLSEAFAAGCDRAFPGRRGWFSRFWHDSHRWDHPYPAWFHDWVEKFERLAVILRAWQPSLVPGLLQTADYARAIFASWRRDSGDAVEVNVAARIGRQRILDGEGPPDLRVLLDESVLCREVGSAAVMHGQLEHLLGMARRPNVSVQVVPTAARAYLGLAGAFSIARTRTCGDSAGTPQPAIDSPGSSEARLFARKVVTDLRDGIATDGASTGVFRTDHLTDRIVTISTLGCPEVPACADASRQHPDIPGISDIRRASGPQHGPRSSASSRPCRDYLSPHCSGSTCLPIASEKMTSASRLSIWRLSWLCSTRC
jgi:hypothetical protein